MARDTPPVGLENSQEARNRSSWDFMSLREAVWEGLRVEIGSLVDNRCFISYTQERKQNNIGFGANVCGMESSLGGRALFLRKDALTTNSPIAGAIAGVAAFNHVPG